MPSNNTFSPVACHANHFLNDEVQCQHSFAQGERCSLAQAPADTVTSLEQACPKRHYFAPGTIEGGSSDLRMDADAGWVLDMRWHDWVAGLAIVIIVGAVAGWAA